MANPFYGLTEPELTGLRTTTLGQLTAVLGGQIYEDVTVGGKQFRRRLPDATTLRTNLSFIMSELRRLDPDTYGVRVIHTNTYFGNYDPK